MEGRKVYWEFLVAIFLVIGTILGVTIPLHLGMQNQVEAIRQDMNQFNESMRQDMNQFHREMREMHGRVCTVEEKNKDK